MKSSLVSLLLLCSCAQAIADENPLYWRTDHRPPASILYGPDKDQGFIDYIRDSLIAELPQYQHHKKVSALDKLFNDMAHGKPICNPLLFVTKERQQYAYFSIPATITPAMRIVMTKKLAQELQLTEPIDLEKLLKEKHTFATVTARSYGPYIDKTLLEQSNKYSHVKMSVDDHTRLFKLLEKGRVEFTFAYPFELNYFLSKNQGTDFTIFTIKGTNAYTLGSVACSKTVWGKEVIDKVNMILKRQRKHHNAIEIMNRWWPEESEKPAFKKFYKEVFLTSTQPQAN